MDELICCARQIAGGCPNPREMHSMLQTAGVTGTRHPGKTRQRLGAARALNGKTTVGSCGAAGVARTKFTAGRAVEIPQVDPTVLGGRPTADERVVAENPSPGGLVEQVLPAAPNRPHLRIARAASGGRRARARGRDTTHWNGKQPSSLASAVSSGSPGGKSVAGR